MYFTFKLAVSTDRILIIQNFFRRFGKKSKIVYVFACVTHKLMITDCARNVCMTKTLLEGKMLEWHYHPFMLPSAEL